MNFHLDIILTKDKKSISSSCRIHLRKTSIGKTVDFRSLTVPIGPTVIDEFIAKNRATYMGAYSRIKSKVAEELTDLEIYNIYGREQRTGGDIFKESRKIRLKFNSYHSKAGHPTGSLWETPDIVGFTVVVAFPSEISRVCAKIDAMVESGLLKAKNSPISRSDDDDIETPIVSAHGRAILTKGYFACHYNLFEEGVDDSRSAICEIQIKTVLHDAWGAKTHDLTYKNSGQVDQSLVRSFELLGDSLAKLDQQSDLARTSIQRQLRAWDGKRNAILRTQLERHFSNAVASSKTLELEGASLLAVTPHSPKKEIERLRVVCLAEFKKGDKRSGAKCLFFLGKFSRDDSLIDTGIEAYQDLESSLPSVSERARAAAVSGLMNFFSGDSERAIDETKRAIDILSENREKDLKLDELSLFKRLKHSMLSSVGYYYADTIGSDRGRKISASENARKYLDLSLSIRRRIKYCPNSAPTDRKSVLRALRHPSMGETNYSTIDNEIFIRIQLANSESELKILRKSLMFLNENPPPSMIKEAGLLYDFHDYCARSRLMDLERS